MWLWFYKFCEKLSVISAWESQRQADSESTGFRNCMTHWRRHDEHNGPGFWIICLKLKRRNYFCWSQFYFSSRHIWWWNVHCNQLHFCFIYQCRTGEFLLYLCITVVAIQRAWYESYWKWISLSSCFVLFYCFNHYHRKDSCSYFYQSKNQKFLNSCFRIISEKKWASKRVSLVWQFYQTEDMTVPSGLPSLMYQVFYKNNWLQPHI